MNHFMSISRICEGNIVEISDALSLEGLAGFRYHVMHTIKNWFVLPLDTTGFTLSDYIVGTVLGLVKGVGIVGGFGLGTVLAYLVSFVGLSYVLKIYLREVLEYFRNGFKQAVFFVKIISLLLLLIYLGPNI